MHLWEHIAIFISIRAKIQKRLWRKTSSTESGVPGAFLALCALQARTRFAEGKAVVGTGAHGAFDDAVPWKHIGRGVDCYTTVRDVGVDID